MLEVCVLLESSQRFRVDLFEVTQELASLNPLRSYFLSHSSFLDQAHLDACLLSFNCAKYLEHELFKLMTHSRRFLSNPFKLQYSLLMFGSCFGNAILAIASSA